MKKESIYKNRALNVGMRNKIFTDIICNFVDEPLRKIEETKKADFFTSLQKDYDDGDILNKIKACDQFINQSQVTSVNIPHKYSCMSKSKKSFTKPDGTVVKRKIKESLIISFDSIQDAAINLMERTNLRNISSGEIDKTLRSLTDNTYWGIINNAEDVGIDMVINQQDNKTTSILKFGMNQLDILEIDEMNIDWISGRTIDIMSDYYRASYNRGLSEARNIISVAKVIIHTKKFGELIKILPEVESMGLELFGNPVVKALSVLNEDDIKSLCKNMKSRGIDSVACVA